MAELPVDFFTHATFEATPADGFSLGNFALKLFGIKDGIELDLPQHIPHQPLELCSALEELEQSDFGAHR